MPHGLFRIVHESGNLRPAVSLLRGVAALLVRDDLQGVPLSYCFSRIVTSSVAGNGLFGWWIGACRVGAR